MGAGSSTEAEREPLLTPSRVDNNAQPVNGRVYRRRWLVLTLFSLLGLMQGMVWNFWGPIQNSAVHAYGFSKSDIAVLVLWGPLGFVPWLLFMWLLDKKGKQLFWYTVSPSEFSQWIFTGIQPSVVNNYPAFWLLLSLIDSLESLLLSLPTWNLFFKT